MTNKVKGTCVPIEHMVLGPIETNVYIVDDGAGCIVVDPASNVDAILNALGGRKVDAILITHGHFDHTCAAAALREATGAPVIVGVNDMPMVTGEGGDKRHKNLVVPCAVDRTVVDGDVVEIGTMKWQVIDTPGHTPGGVCYFLEPADGQTGAPVLLSGDTLFAGTHGRTDFPESIPSAMVASLKRLADLPESTIVLPGHNHFTTIGRERPWLSRGGIVR